MSETKKGENPIFTYTYHSDETGRFVLDNAYDRDGNDITEVVKTALGIIEPAVRDLEINETGNGFKKAGTE